MVRYLTIIIDDKIRIKIDTTEYNTTVGGNSTFYEDIVKWLKDGTSLNYIYETPEKLICIPRSSYITIKEVYI